MTIYFNERRKYMPSNKMEACLQSNCSSYLSGPIGQTFASAVQYLFASQCLITHNWPEDKSEQIKDLNFDYIVIGAGSAGSVVASRLSEDAFRRVLLIEAGGDPPFESEIISAWGSLIKSEYDWQYRTENDSRACQGCRDGRCSWAKGKMLGGGSSMNGMVYVRGNYRDYDDLQKAGNENWNADIAIKYFKKSENLTDPELETNPYYKKFHGRNGLLDVAPYRSTTNVALRKHLIEAYRTIGYGEVADISDLKNYDVVQGLGTIKDGRRESTATAYLVPARDRNNLVLFKNALATTLIFDGKRATGVNIRLKNGTEIKAFARLEVIVSAGVVKTPQLLMLSGIGPRSHLEEKSIPVIADLAVGQNLHDHQMLPFFITLNEGAPPKSIEENAVDIAQFLALRKGPYSDINFGDIMTYLNVNNKYRKDAPDIQFHHIHVRTRSPSLVSFCNVIQGYNDQICESLYELNKNNEMLMIWSATLSPKSRGHIELTSSNPDDKPRIFANYFSEPEDVDSLVKSASVVNRLVNTPILQKFGAELRKPNIPQCDGFKFNTEPYWRCAVFEIGACYWHQMGTSKMGPPIDPKAVVDSKLRVYGIENLRIVDASIIPSAISGNTNAPVIMVSERGADFIKEAHKNDCKKGKYN